MASFFACSSSSLLRALMSGSRPELGAILRTTELLRNSKSLKNDSNQYVEWWLAGFAIFNLILLLLTFRHRLQVETAAAGAYEACFIL